MPGLILQHLLAQFGLPFTQDGEYFVTIHALYTSCLSIAGFQLALKEKGGDIQIKHGPDFQQRQ